MTAALLLLQFPCSAPVAHPLIYGEAASEKGPYREGGGGWMDGDARRANAGHQAVLFPRTSPFQLLCKLSFEAF